jgi:hypothetical protein
VAQAHREATQPEFLAQLSRKLMMVDRAGLENWIATGQT